VSGKQGRRRSFVDDQGVIWTERGGTLSASELARMVRNPEIIVCHDYLGNLRPIPVDERLSFWADAESRMRESTFSEFYGQEYKSEDRRHLVVITEYC